MRVVVLADRSFRGVGTLYIYNKLCVTVVIIKYVDVIGILLGIF